MNIPESLANPPPASFWRRRVVLPIAAQLSQGISPEKIALTVALGVVIGIFPILGATTLICAAVAWRLKLNQPIMQLVNYLMYPPHLLLLLPFYRTGESLFGSGHVPIFSVTELVERFRAGPMQFFIDYGMVGFYGVVVWCLIAPVAIAILYFGLRIPLRAMGRRMGVAQA